MLWERWAFTRYPSSTKWIPVGITKELMVARKGNSQCISNKKGTFYSEEQWMDGELVLINDVS